MTITGLRREWLLRSAAGVLSFGTLLAAPLVLHTPPDDGAALLFFLIVLTSAGMVLLVRGQGGGVGAGVGLSLGLLLAIGLTQATPAAAGSSAFFLIAGGLLGLLGYLAGTTWQPAVSSPDSGRRRDRAALQAGFDRTGAARADDGQAAATLALDFVRWRRANDLNGAASRECWAAFDVFIRQSLRGALGATGVRLQRVSDDGTALLPLTPPAVEHATAPAVARAGDWRAVLDSRKPWLADAVTRSDPTATPQALLPLRGRGQPSGLITISGFESPHEGLAERLRSAAVLLETLWSYWHSQYGDCGPAAAPRLLARSAVLEQVAQRFAAARAAGEPLVVLAIQIEGLRALDDRGRWTARDELIRRIESLLRQHVQGDDAAGRFSDDHFVLLLCRKHRAAGVLIAKELVDSLRRHIAETSGDAPLPDSTQPPLTPRAGVAALAPVPAGRCACGDAMPVTHLATEASAGTLLLEHALMLVEEARTRNQPFASSEVALCDASSNPVERHVPTDSPTDARGACS